MHKASASYMKKNISITAYQKRQIFKQEGNAADRQMKLTIGNLICRGVGMGGNTSKFATKKRRPNC